MRSNRIEGCRSFFRTSSTTTRHSTTSSTTSVLRRRLRPYPLYILTLIVVGRSSVNCEFLRTYERCYRSSRAWVVLDWLLVSTVTDLFVFCIYNLSVLSIPGPSVFLLKCLCQSWSKILIYLINLFQLFKSIHLLRARMPIVTVLCAKVL